jgi:hypothetical protein
MFDAKKLQAVADRQQDTIFDFPHGREEKRKITPIFAWYDFWVGVFWDRHKRCLYIFPIPCVGIRIQLRR